MAKKKNKLSNLYYFNLVYQFFLETFIGIAIGYFGGKYFDKLLFNENKKIFVYIFLVLGIFSALANLIRRVLNKLKRG